MTFLDAYLTGGLVTLIAVTALWMRVSGIVLLEQSLKKRKPEYEYYIEKTSAFFPMPPKS